MKKKTLPTNRAGRPIVRYIRIGVSDVLDQAIEELRDVRFNKRAGFATTSSPAQDYLFFAHVFEEAIYALLAYKDQTGREYCPQPFFDVGDWRWGRRGYDREKLMDAINLVLLKAAGDERIDQTESQSTP